VWKVRRKKDQNIYVLKEVDTTMMSTEEKRSAICEAKILSKIDSEYVCKYFDSFMDDVSINIIMEFCESGDLQQYIKRQAGKQLREETVWKFFIEMCLGLNYLHTFKILHRDIKSMNIFLAKDNQVKIGDLGVARQLTQTNAMAETVVGTPYYLSPELCEEKPYNHKSDIWSLGCVLYELCTFRYPFEA
jgi:NIMA (never in mitosis gene a)-related kinase